MFYGTLEVVFFNGRLLLGNDGSNKCVPNIIFHSVFLFDRMAGVSLCDAYWKCTRTLPSNAISPILIFFLLRLFFVSEIYQDKKKKSETDFFL